MSCKVLHAGKLSESFKVKTGVWRGCLLSPFLFLLVIDWIMKTTTTGKKNGIQWILWTQLDDLDFADSFGLLSTKLATTSLGVGLRVNRKKTNLLKINTSTNTTVTVGGEPIQEVDSFTYLGSIIDRQGGTDSDITARVGKAKAVFIILKNIWSSREIAMTTKVQIFNSNVKSILLYSSEMWEMTKKTL